MIIKSIQVKNFRSILDETLPFDQLTVLVGPNGSGKSSFLRALDLFYTANPKFGREDFYAEDMTQDIEITVTFTKLETEETDRFSSYLEGNHLTVVRVLSLKAGKPSAKYHGSSLQNPDFTEVREAGKAADKKAAYERLREDSKYSDLPKWTKQEEALVVLKSWETNHPDLCIRQRDDGQFFGFTEVAYGYLGKYTRFILIPAVRDAADDVQEGRGTPITEILDLVVRSVLAEREDLGKLKEDTQKKYDEIMDPENLVELSALENQLTKTLKTYVPDASVSLLWIKASGVEIPMPKAEVKLVEDGYSSTVVRTGHGLQRAFILTMLQHLAVAQPPVKLTAESETTGEGQHYEQATQLKMPNLILGIEEPELYQHPNRQRHMAKILIQLATGTILGVAQKTQVIYSTHSPLFLSLDRFDQIRRLRKVPHDLGRPKISKLKWSNLDEVAQILWEKLGKPEPKFTGDTLRPRLQTIMTPWMNEGFFADVVVLVEGEDDRAAILGMAANMECDLEASGISIIPCNSKNSLDRPFAIFDSFNILTYIIWDSDEGKSNADPSYNRYLLRLMNSSEEDWPAIIADNFACFKSKMETTICEDIGEECFNKHLRKAQEELEIVRKDQAIKYPVVIHRVIQGAKTDGKSCSTLECIVNKIIALGLRGAGR